MNRHFEPFKQLEELLGYVQNGSDTTVRIFQDDATRTYHVEVGSQGNQHTYYGDSLGAAIASAYASEPDRY